MDGALVHQLNSTSVSVNWSNLWNSLKWPSPCVEQLQIVVNEDEIIVSDPIEIKNSEKILNVPACQELNIEVKLKNFSSEEWISSFINQNNQTYKSPKFKENAKIQVNYAMNEYDDDILDLQRIHVQGTVTRSLHTMCNCKVYTI